MSGLVGARPKMVVWDPAGSSKFIVGGASELRMLRWEHTKSTSRFHTLAVCSDLGQLRSFAWSPHDQYPDLVAVGLHAGRILALRLDSSPSALRSQGPPPSAVQINIRHSRPCNVVTFCPNQPGLLAVGLEKGRGESLLIYDIETSARSLDSGKDTPAPNSNATATPKTFNHRDTAIRAHSPAPPAPEPFVQLAFGSSESVSSAAFLASEFSKPSSPLLVAAMAGKWLRAYDLRDPPTTVMTWGTRAVHSIAASPFNDQQFVSSGEDGIVRLWDLRKPMDPLLSFSEVDAGAISAKVRPTVVAKPLTEILWSPTQRGVLTTLEKDSNSLRVWNLADGPLAKVTEVGADDTAERNRASSTQHHASSPSIGSVDSMRLPVLLDDQRPPSFHQPLASFAFAQSPLNSSATHFIGVSRDAQSNGNSGHRLEIVELPSRQHTSFLPLHDGILLSTDSPTLEVRTVNFGATTASETAPTRPSKADDADDEAEEGEAQATEGGTTRLSRGRSLSLNTAVLTTLDRNQTPRPGQGGSVTPRRLSMVRGSFGAGESNEEELTGPSALEAVGKDVSSLFGQRVMGGYGSHALVNMSLFDSTLGEFWKWIARAEMLSKDAFCNDYDFRMRGVIPIIVGFPSISSSAASTSTTSPRQSHHSPKPTSRTLISDIHRSIRRGDEAQTKNAAYLAAATALVAKRRMDGTFAISSSAFAAQRKLALSVCGSDWEEDFEVVCARFVKADNHEGAARHAFFSGHIERAMHHLRSCKAEKLRTLTPILAAYLSQGDLKGNDSPYADLCRSLSSEVEEPWIRAMFAFLASGDWRELLDEAGLPLSDRIAVALRFLSDSELLPFLQETGSEALASGDLEAVVLFGLRGEGLKLLSVFLDRSADVQTVGLACSFISPGIIRHDRRVDRWISTYRNVLDGLQLYSARANFDGARGRRARAAMEQSRLNGKNSEAMEVEAALRKAAPPQIVLRCQFCSTNITPSSHAPKGAAGGRAGAGPVGIKATLCPSCSKGLPACSVCLGKASVHSLTAGMASNLCWCQSCRHGGHADHILEWFDRSDVCPVADCDCRCRT